MWTATVLHFVVIHLVWSAIPLVDKRVEIAPGMCFFKQDPPSNYLRNIVIKSHKVANETACKKECWDTETCLAIFYEATGSFCVLLGEERKEFVCSNKNQTVKVKCAAETTIATTTLTNYIYPACAGDLNPKRGPVKPVSACDKAPEEYGIECNDDFCYCADREKQFVINNGTFYGAFMLCFGKRKWNVGSRHYNLPYDTAFKMNWLMGACKPFSPTSFEKCMCDMPGVYGAVRDGDKLCGSTGVDFWYTNDIVNNYNPLTCAENGWISGGVVVKPVAVMCKGYS